MEPARPISGWPLLRRVLAEQKRGLIAGMVVGLLWSASKVTVPRLTRLAVDKGVIGGGSLWFWSPSTSSLPRIIAGDRANMVNHCSSGMSGRNTGSGIFVSQS